MNISNYGENDFGFVYVQGEKTPNSNINEALKNAGGKLKDCNIDDYSTSGPGKAKPDFQYMGNYIKSLPYSDRI